MKKTFSLMKFAFVMVAVCASTVLKAASETEIYSVPENFVPTDNQEVAATSSVKLIYGADGGWKTSADSTPYATDMPNAVTGGGNPKDGSGTTYNATNKTLPTTGTYFIFEASKAGTIKAAILLNSDKPLIVADSEGNCISDNIVFTSKSGSKVELDSDYKISTKTAGLVTFNVEANTQYYLFCTGSKLGFGGFYFEEAKDPATAPTFTPEGGDVMAFSIITLASTASKVYYQWKDDDAVLTKDSEGWTEGANVTVPNEVGATKYLYAYATNGDGLESAVVSQTYNITEFNLTAVTSKTWTFTTAGGWPAEEVAKEEEIRRDNIIITGDIAFNGSVLPFPGAGSATSRNVQFMVAPNTRITIECASTNNDSRTVNINTNTFDKNSPYGTVATPTNKAKGTGSIDYIGTEAATLIVYSYASGINLYSIKVEPLPTETKEVTEAGWATYTPESNALFEDGDAYVVTAVNAANVEIEGVTAVPAGTPVLLKDKGEKTITLTTATIEAPEKNLLAVYDGEQEGKVAYVLAKDEVNGAGFKKWTGEASVLTDRAVLWLGETQAARGFFALDGEATGIENVATAVAQESAVYDLQGRRVAQPKAGLYIVNGKKVVVK